MKIFRMLFLLAGTALLFAGCNKQDFGRYSRKAGEQVVFGINSKSDDTRTKYDDVTTGGIRPINWVENDMIRVYSPDATRAFSGEPQHWADYKVSPLATNPNKGTLNHVQANGLAWGDAGNHKFYAVYPSPGANEPDYPNGADGLFKFEIPDRQLVADEMKYAYMTAAAAENGGVSGDAVQLDFYPAYTAFEFHLSADTKVELLNFSLSSSSTAVAGTYLVEYHGLTPTYTLTNEVTNDLTIRDMGRAELGPQTREFVFRIFCLPQDLKDLSITFEIRKVDTNTIENRRLHLDYADGSTVVFKERRLHVITGQMQGTYNFKYITLNGVVLEWESVEVDENTNDLPQAGQFHVQDAVNGETVSGNKDDQQTWLFTDADSDGHLDPITVSFKVFSPVGGTWEVEPFYEGSGESAFKVEYLNGNTWTEAAGKFNGRVNTFDQDATSGATKVTFRITYLGNNASDRIWFKTYVIDNGEGGSGTRYGLDSETQLYDMRGYHYFQPSL